MTRLALLCLSLIVSGGCARDTDHLRVPPGFRIAIYSDKVPDARALTLGARGTVFVGSMSEGVVYALTDSDGNGRADQVRIIARGLKMPVGVAFRNGDLYVSALSRIVVLRDIENRLDDPPEPEVITDVLPDDEQHGWKFIAFGPDDKLYVPIGAPCNICDRGNDYAKLVRMNADGSGLEDVAYGIRNTVGFTWHPVDGRLWFTDNGRDLLGDDLPDDELNVISRPGEHFGFPWCHQGDLPDPELGADRDCADFTAPVHKLGPHVAALGLRFYTGSMFPPEYRNALIIAQRGSWNRSERIGYRVMAAHLQDDRVIRYEPLVDGFLHDQKRLGRPVDVQVMADGAVLVSDQMAGTIYRITWSAASPAQE